MQSKNHGWLLAVFLFASCSGADQSDANGTIMLKDVTGITLAKYTIKADRKGPHRYDGTYQTWYGSGFPRERSVYQMGNKDGLWETWSKDGMREFTTNYKEGKEDGGFSSFYPETGEVFQEGQYANRKMHGIWNEYTKDGNLRLIHRFDSLIALVFMTSAYISYESYGLLVRPCL